MKIIETTLYTDKLEESEKFYTDILELKLIRKREGRHLFFKCEDSILILFNPEATKSPDGFAPTHGTVEEGHMAFGVSKEELENWKRKLINAGVDIEKEVEWDTGAKSIYFRDPGNNSLEIIDKSHWE